ncbi:MAG: hypothetical protein RIC14_11150 [Filomicrobium sp.]
MDEPSKPIDCFSDEEKNWAVEQIKSELPEEWSRLVNRHAYNMKRYEPREAEQNQWLKDGLKHRQAVKKLTLDFGNDGWELSREHIIHSALMRAAILEASSKFPK